MSRLAEAGQSEMTARKFYYREFVIRVLSSEPVTSAGELSTILDEHSDTRAVWSSCEGPLFTKKKTLSGRQAAKELLSLGASPDLFNLDDQGNDLET